jgi:ketosteroid isomerase-like protein
MTVRLPAVLAAAALLLPALSACEKAAAPVDAAKETAAINARINAFNAAAKAKDSEKLTAIDADDVRVYGGAQNFTGKDRDLAFSRSAMADPGYSVLVTPEYTEVAKGGDMAFQTGTYESTGTNPATKAVVHAKGYWVGAWRKGADGIWKLAAVSSAPPPPPAVPKK